MSYNGSGVFNINTAGQPVVTGTVISSTAFNALTADLATGLTTALTKDGQTTPTANIPMGGFKITGIAAATTLGDALSYGRAATVSTLTNSALTSGRVPYATTAGLLTDSANLLYSGTDLTVYGLTVGRGAGAVSTNVAFGASALASNTSGANNVAIGQSSLYNNTTGVENISVGASALVNNSTGSYNSALGRFALANNTTASNNTAVGYQASYSNTTGNNNVAVGYNAGYATTGTGNSIFGYGANQSGTSAGNYNTLLGFQAGRVNTGADNVFVGAGTGDANTSGGSNTGIGRQALNANTTASGNSALGYQAGYSVTTGANNTFIGYQAGAVTNATTTGSGNVYIGFQSYGSAVGNSREIAIGYNVAGQGSNIVTLGSDLGKIYCSYTVNATWIQTSDGRMKKDIKDDSLGLSFINRLRPRTFTWKPSNELDQSNPYYAEENKRDTTTVIHGLVAQEVKEALDAEGVDTFAGWVEGVDGVQAISREMYISPLIKAIQELTAKVNALESQLKGA